MSRPRGASAAFAAWGTDDDIRANRGLVVSCARRVNRYGLSIVELDDLLSVGTVALARALVEWVPERGPLSGYLWVRITRAMFDELRAVGAQSRSARWRKNAIKVARARVWARDRRLTAVTVAAELQISVERLRQWEDDFAAFKSVEHFETVMGTLAHAAREDHADRVDLLRRAMAVLSPTMRDVIHRRFWREEPIARVAAAYGWEQSNVSGTVKRALVKLRRELIRLGYDTTGHTGRVRGVVVRRRTV